MFGETAPDLHHHLVDDVIRRDRFELIFSCILQITVNSMKTIGLPRSGLSSSV